MRFGAALKGPQILHIALLASIGIYAAILAVVVSQPAPEGWKPIDLTLFEIVLGVVAVGVQVAIVVLRKKKLPPVLEGAPIDDAHQLDARENEALGKMRAGMIMTWAMCESCAIYGLVLGFLSRDLVPFVPFAVLGAASMIYYRPTRAYIEGVVRGAHG